MDKKIQQTAAKSKNQQGKKPKDIGQIYFEWCVGALPPERWRLFFPRGVMTLPRGKLVGLYSQGRRMTLALRITPGPH